MWIVSLDDLTNEEEVDVIATDFNDLQRILDYVKMKEGRFELLRVELRLMIFGFDGLRDMAGEYIPDKI
jgi:hypothetical protein